MKRHIQISFFLLVLSFVPRILWDYYELPYRYVPWIGSLICAIYFVLSLRADNREIKMQERRKDELKEQLLQLSDDVMLEDGDTVDDLVILCEIDELERVLSTLKEMPEGKRRLQDAVAVLDDAD